MKPVQFMLIAGEPSGDALAAELVKALKPAVIESQDRLTSDVQPLTTTLDPQFFGAGGPKMAEAGVELVINLTAHAVFGLTEVLKQYPKFKRFFRQLFQLAIERAPDVIILVDYAGFNRRFAAAIKRYVRSRQRTFNNWKPKIVYYVSPQVWASREYRTYQLARDVDLLLSIFPFEKDWYAQRVPQLRVEFVGHPMVDRYRSPEARRQKAESFHTPTDSASRFPSPSSPLVLLLPGSREQELRHHLPVMAEAAKRIAAQQSIRLRMVLPNEKLIGIVRPVVAALPDLEIKVGSLAESLSEASLAIASSGTVILECAFFGVPTVVLYKVSWPTYQLARRVVKVKYIAMPSLLAGETVYPELIQDMATVDNIAREALGLLTNGPRQSAMRKKLANVVESLGPPGAAQRAAKAVVELLQTHPGSE